MQNISNNISVLFSGTRSPADVFIKEVDSTRMIDATLEEKCKRAWDTMLIEAAQAKRKLWDSDIYRFESADKNGKKLNLSLSTIPFSIRLGMNMHTNEIKRLGTAYASQGIFTSCFVQTTDNVYIFLEKSEHYFTPKKISFIGGVVSKSERTLINGRDLFEEVGKEIKEEIGVYIRNIDHIHLKTGYRTENFNVCFLFEVLVPFTFSEVQEIFSKDHGDEAKNIIGFSRDTLASRISLFEPKDAVKFKILDLVETLSKV